MPVKVALGHPYLRLFAVARIGIPEMHGEGVGEGLQIPDHILGFVAGEPIFGEGGNMGWHIIGTGYNLVRAAGP
ncbi:hypothetical protein D3C75_959120 [compost metagenome]